LQLLLDMVNDTLLRTYHFQTNLTISTQSQI